MLIDRERLIDWGCHRFRASIEHAREISRELNRLFCASAPLRLYASAPLRLDAAIRWID
jgi:uncharacterized ParB-like nuclease family protein